MNNLPTKLSLKERLELKASQMLESKENPGEAVGHQPTPLIPKTILEQIPSIPTKLTLAERLKRTREAAGLSTRLVQLANEKTLTKADSGREAIKNIIEKQKEELNKLPLSERLALLKKQQELEDDKLLEALGIVEVPNKESPPAEKNSLILPDEIDEVDESEVTFSTKLVLNDKQLAVKEMMLMGKSCVVTGAAGTGKTTVQRAGAEALLQSTRLSITSFKIQGTREYVEAPSIAFVAYTRRASANLRRAIHSLPHLEKELIHNIMTIHALLEYEPITYIEAGIEKFRFEPKRTAANPLTITHLVIEEASMLGLDLWEKLYDALPTGVQIVFIGDINQLPPVFGASIMNYALVDLPVIELTEVYRQAQGSPVLENAHRILRGEDIIEEEKNGGSFRVVRGKNPTAQGQEKTSFRLGTLFEQWHDIGFYDESKDIILSPWNKQFLGTDNMNNWIAQFLGRKRNAMVYEILAGFARLYLAVGDRVVVNKMDGYITKISHNPEYAGRMTQTAGTDLSRFGTRVIQAGSKSEDLDKVLLNYNNFSLDELEKADGERKMQASHIVEVELDGGMTISMKSAGDFGPAAFSLGYCLTVHKAQGCEWRKVFIILHKDHAISLYRELLYTAITRARHDVILIAKDDVITKAIKNQKIKGNTLADKIAYFNSGFQKDPTITVTK